MHRGASLQKSIGNTALLTLTFKISDQAELRWKQEEIMHLDYKKSPYRPKGNPSYTF